MAYMEKKSLRKHQMHIVELILPLTLLQKQRPSLRVPVAAEADACLPSDGSEATNQEGNMDTNSSICWQRSTLCHPERPSTSIPYSSSCSSICSKSQGCTSIQLLASIGYRRRNCHCLHREARKRVKTVAVAAERAAAATRRLSTAVFQKS